MDKQDQDGRVGEVNRLIKEKAKRGLEFGKSLTNSGQKDTVHSEQPKSNHKGIDRGQWAD